MIKKKYVEMDGRWKKDQFNKLVPINCEEMNLKLSYCALVSRQGFNLDLSSSGFRGRIGEEQNTENRVSNIFYIVR